jgi:hypothetical protein
MAVDAVFSIYLHFCQAIGESAKLKRLCRILLEQMQSSFCSYIGSLVRMFTIFFYRLREYLIVNLRILSAVGSLCSVFGKVQDMRDRVRDEDFVGG